MTKNEQIEQIARKTSSDLTADDRAFIETMSQEMGVEFEPRPRCADCYSDQAVLLLHKIREKKPATSEYALKDGVDVLFMGQRINADTLTNDLAEQILAAGFPAYLFATIKSA